MNLKGIISISGKPGLYKVVAQSKNNIIVESLEDKKRFPAYTKDKISALDDISIYTYDEDVSLKDVFLKIIEKEDKNNCISYKENKENLENYLTEILPNYNKERVYLSDVKKIFQWYNLLHKTGDLFAKEEISEEVVEETETLEKGEKPEKKKVKSESPNKVKVIKKDVKTTSKTNLKSAGTKKASPIKTGSSRGK
ncbi:MAG: DUF5606 domain-containing protein [Flavobacteriia bacterium]|nr:DUF5606 domain-containing protein [Flavobacteriia bacterium]